MKAYSESEFSKDLRKGTEHCMPRVAAVQVENKASSGGADYHFIFERLVAMVELKVDKSKDPDRVKIKLYANQRNRLKKHERLGTPAFVLLYSKGRVYLIRASRLSVFSSLGWADFKDVESNADAEAWWRQGLPPETTIRAIVSFLFRDVPRA